MKKKRDYWVWAVAAVVGLFVVAFAVEMIFTKSVAEQHRERQAEEREWSAQYRRDRDELRRAQRDLDHAGSESERVIARRALERVMDEQEGRR